MSEPQPRLFRLPLLCLWLALLLTVATISVAAAQPAAPSVAISLTPRATGLNSPVDLAATPQAGDSRLFIVEQSGRIRIMRNSGSLLRRPFLDIQDRVSSGSERGLLGLAFHPDYAANGYFYVNYTNLSGDTTISRFSVSGSRNLADPNSEQILLVVDQPFANHNGGDLAFGPDGYLYIALGDGGSGGDPLNNSQNIDSLLGKILRIDVDGGAPYAIPADNPFVGLPGADEIWAYGLRNPWRISFDRQTGDFFIADVGQSAREEIDFQAAGSAGGANYGWRCYEGTQAYNLSGCNPDPGVYDFPAHEYTHSEGCAITGGFVYRGALYPTLAGHYFFADYCSGTIWALLPDGMGGWTLTDHGALLSSPTTFGENAKGELFVADAASGTVYAVTAAPAR